MARRETYQAIIDRDRQQGDPDAAESRRVDGGRGEPPHARRSYRRRRALNADLERYYEHCRAESGGRFRSERRAKNYCAAVAWTRVRREGRFPDYPTFRQQEETADMKMQRDSKGRFKKRSSTGNRSSSRRSSESRRSSPASAARETRRAPSHRSSPRRKSSARSYESKPRKSSSHRSSTRRSSSRKPTQTNIAIVPVGAMREASRRSASPRRYRARDGSRTVVSMTAGGITLLFVSASVGFIVADVLDRYIAGVDPAASPAPTLPAPYATVDNPIPKYNNDAQAMQPGWGRMGAQFALGLFGIALGAALKTPALKFTFYGLGLGAMTHLSAQIVTAYIIVPMSKSSTGAGARMYQHEINVYNGLANPSGGILGKGPAQLGAPAQQTKRNDAPPQLPANQPQGRMPAALASQATRQEVPVGTPAASPPARAAAPAAAPAPAPAAAASPATMGQPPAHQSGCGCQQCKPAEQPSNGGTGAHPMFSYKFRHAIGAQRRAA